MYKIHKHTHRYNTYTYVCRLKCTHFSNRLYEACWHGEVEIHRHDDVIGVLHMNTINTVTKRRHVSALPLGILITRGNSIS